MSLGSRRPRQRTVNKRDESPRKVLLSQPHLRDIGDKQSPELQRHFQVISRAQRLAAQVVKTESRHVVAALGHEQSPSPNTQLAICDEFAVLGRKRMEDLVHFGTILWCQGVEINLLQRSRDPSIVSS